MTPEQHIEEIFDALVKVGISAEKTSAYEILIRGVSSEVGDISIELSSDEWILRIGCFFHRHFSAAINRAPETEQLIQTVTDFVRNRSLLTLTYSGKRPVTARLKNLDTGESSIVALPSNRCWWSPLLSPFVNRRESTRSFRWLGPVSESGLPDSEEGCDESTLAAKIAGLSPDQARQLAEYLSQKST